jgi:hypothetical protein
MYTKSNTVNLNISSDVALRISQDSAKKYLINLEDDIAHYSLGYFGTYSIDLTNPVLTHHVAGGSIPYYINSDQRRPFSFKGDTLIIGDNKTWKRVPCESRLSSVVALHTRPACVMSADR